MPAKNSICSNCLETKNRFFNLGFTIFNYNNENVKKLIELIKFYDMPQLINIMDNYSKLLKTIPLKSACIIPVPMHKKDIRMRGYNQAVLIAKKLRQIIGFDICFDCVEKIKQTKHQVGLTAKERKTNLKGAFKLLKLPRQQTILIVDDVFTTGSTVNEIAKLFYKENIECYFFSLAATPMAN